MTHHPDCDGYRTANDTTIEGGGTGYLLIVPGEHGHRYFPTIGQAEAAQRKHDRMVECTGQCEEW